jgi:hypothetical protein
MNTYTSTEALMLDSTVSPLGSMPIYKLIHRGNEKLLSFPCSPHFTVYVSSSARSRAPACQFCKKPLYSLEIAAKSGSSNPSPNLPSPSRIPPPPLPVLHRLRCPTTAALQRPVPRQLSLLHPLIPIHPLWRLVSGSTSGGDVSPRGRTQGRAAAGPRMPTALNVAQPRPEGGCATVDAAPKARSAPPSPPLSLPLSPPVQAETMAA